MVELPEPLAAASLRCQIALREVADGTLDPTRANAVANLARALCRLHEVWVVEDRLDAVERHLTDIEIATGPTANGAKVWHP